MGAPQRQAAGPGGLRVGGHTAAAGCGAQFLTFLRLGGRYSKLNNYIIGPNSQTYGRKTTSKKLKSPANQEMINGEHCAQNTDTQAPPQIGFLKITPSLWSVKSIPLPILAPRGMVALSDRRYLINQPGG